MNEGTDPSPAEAIKALDRAATRHELPFAHGTMVWREWGRGPTIALAHGGFGSWLHWFRNIETLATRYRVLACDIPGLGESDEIPGLTHPMQLGEVQAASLGALLDGEKAHLVGFSFGALVSGQAALVLGEQAAGFTLVGASGLGLPREPMELIRRTPAMSENERRCALRSNLTTLMLRHASSVDDLAVEIQTRNDARARVKSRRLSLGSSLRDALPDVSARLSGIWGELDQTAVPDIDARRQLIQATQPEARFEVIPDAGHWVAYEAPDAFTQALLGLLEV